MAPAATTDLIPTTGKTYTEPTNALATAPEGDWRAQLRTDGYAVIKGAIPLERALEYQRKARKWLKSFGNDDLDYENPQTWLAKNLPVQSTINTFSAYGVSHEKFMWDARMEPGVTEAFAQIWGTDELLVSFDSLNITFPNRKDVPRKGAWEHVDQSPFRRGMHCVQGIINLSTSGPNDGGLVVYPGSHRYHDDFFDGQTDRATWGSKDLYWFKEDQLSWFKSRGIAPHKICADLGDLIVWDSRTIHYGAEPTEEGNVIRTVIYAAYSPARLASPETLERKAAVFRRYGGTTHWPHDNVVIRKTWAILPDGTRDPRDRDEPLELPDVTDQLLKLAGVKPY
ncbi:phytanoyl-CoA dioxygenase [Aspergillus sclerotioniger CBS 115572]|uniref:Phytanoyl-CoA dioxygenase n=1 Tax=Aspergillus sclerotioniger CBS 115572 TaxID=1450535 RepID=A0A317WNC0_9EURO|nr:phytanoyl-CoA dioxygenase [Aspergillus sclerotioniger CBS 115572]PWY87959.1 phytanoyl-CoA dioxygenase [Aspergillus sclerotioniger CBS 115572]